METDIVCHVAFAQGLSQQGIERFELFGGKLGQRHEQLTGNGSLGLEGTGIRELKMSQRC